MSDITVKYGNRFLADLTKREFFSDFVYIGQDHVIDVYEHRNLYKTHYETIFAMTVVKDDNSFQIKITCPGVNFPFTPPPPR